MNSTPYPLRVPGEILELSRLRAQEERLDQATALRQFLYAGVEEYVLQLIAQGRISLGKGAELLKKSVYDMQRLARRHGIEIGATKEQARKSREAAKTLF